MIKKQLTWILMFFFCQTAIPIFTRTFSEPGTEQFSSSESFFTKKAPLAFPALLKKEKKISEKNSQDNISQGLYSQFFLESLLVTGALFALYQTDADINNWVKDRKTDQSRKTADFFEAFGNGLFLAPGIAVFYVLELYLKPDRSNKLSVISAESVVTASLITLVIKLSSHRHRPNDNQGHRVWDGPWLTDKNLSFPSGHTTASFALASAIAHYPDTPLAASILSYGIALCTGLSRIHDEKHWASDVLAGAFIGHWTAIVVNQYNLQKKPREITIVPQFSGDGLVLTFTRTF